jgi:hypothetical protein
MHELWNIIVAIEKERATEAEVEKFGQWTRPRVGGSDGGEPV